jgi:hypothetical protein
MLAAVVALAAAIDPSTILAAQQLHDSTRIPVRLVGGITSETTKTGQELQFVVMSDVIVNDTILIKRDTVVFGEVVRARRVRWGPTRRGPRLAFRFKYTTTVDGTVIALRTSPVRQEYDEIVVRLGRSGHAMVWTGGAILFDAYVNGNYGI